MSFTKTILAVAMACTLAIPAFADGITINDAYVRSAGPSAKTGAAFFGIMNNGDQDDRLIAAHTDIAKRAELHTHIQTDDGVMQMREVKAGFPVEAGGVHMLARGGDHVMLMGLTRPMLQGDTITVTLTFEKAGDITVDIPVDLKRKATAGGMTMKHEMPTD